MKISCLQKRIGLGVFILIAVSGLIATPHPVLAASASPTTVTLAAEGRALLPVVVGANATERTRAAAQTLADTLTKITGAKFQVSVGDGKAGIAVGLEKDFPALAPATPLASQDPTRREDYILHTSPSGVAVLGASELAVEDAVWDLLYRLGYRQFFPGPHWEVIPHAPTLAVALDAREHPAYFARRIWYGYGLWDYNKEPYAEWCAKNRATSGIEVTSGHVYDAILRANKAEFEKHPEYLGLYQGKRQSTKFCIANAGLRQLVVADALKRLERDPAADAISMEPSDGGKWCECGECAKLGSVTDRALLLANEVAAAVAAKYPGKYVGMYAYNFHSAPPAIQARPELVVSLATAFIKGGTWEEMIAGWSKKAGLLGIREYYSVNVWDRDLPASARGGNLAYLTRTIPEFYAKGARFMSAESSDNWGPNGLGYYLSSRLLWDVGEAGKMENLVEDFLTRAFGPAKEAMREFYAQLDGSKPHLVAADQLGRMFRALDGARRLDVSAEVRARLADLTLYARYVDLYQRYTAAKGAARQQAFEALIRHAYRMRATMMIHVRGLYKDLPNRDKTVKLPPGAAMTVAEGKNPWKSSAPFPDAELAGFITEGIARYKLVEVSFQPVAYGEELTGAGALKLAEPAAPGQFGAGRGKQVFYTRVERAPATIGMLITGGLIAHYRDRGNVRLELWKLGGASQSGERETLAASDRSVPPDGTEHAVKIEVKEPGLYKLTLEDGGDRTLLKWNCTLPLTIKSTLAEPMNAGLTDLWQLYFYVPKGTREVVLFGGEHGDVCDSQMRPLFWLNGREPSYYSVKVPDGEDGKLWCLRNSKGPKILLTVPPYFARKPSELILPAEVVAKDGGK